jgi:hypothetical protein
LAPTGDVLSSLNFFPRSSNKTGNKIKQNKTIPVNPPRISLPHVYIKKLTIRAKLLNIARMFILVALVFAVGLILDAISTDFSIQKKNM